MANEFWNKDRPLLMERLGRLLGSTTYRGPDSGGGTPFSARKLTAEAELLVSLKMAARHENDVGPWIVYSLALQVDDRHREIVEWLARKLEQGTGAVGHRNAHRVTIAALHAYRLAVHGIEPDSPMHKPNEFVALVNIGAGWLWMKSESTLDRWEFALRNDGEAALDVKGVIA